MVDEVKFSLIGIDSLLGKLATVNDEVKRKTGRTALRRAAEMVAKNFKEGARRWDDPDTGRSIADNIVLRWNGRLFRRTGDLGFRVGVLHGAVLVKNGSTEKAHRHRIGVCLSLVPSISLLILLRAQPLRTISAKSPMSLLPSSRNRWTGPFVVKRS